MALPTAPSAPEDKLARRRASEEDALLREVDDAVRQDELSRFGERYGRVLVIGAAVVILGFGGFLFWQSRQDGVREAQSETLIAALDQAQAGNFSGVSSAVQPLLSDAAPGPNAGARLLAAGAAVAQDRPDEAARLLSELAADGSAPEALRDLARLRLAALQFDTADKAQIVAQLEPLARADNPWFGSAGELLAMAYLEQGKRTEAGRLFAEVARNESVAEPIRSRTRQMAGVLGVDAIPDVDKFLQQQRSQGQPTGAAPAPAAAAPPPPAA